MLHSGGDHISQISEQRPLPQANVEPNTYVYPSKCCKATLPPVSHASIHRSWRLELTSITHTCGVLHSHSRRPNSRGVGAKAVSITLLCFHLRSARDVCERQQALMSVVRNFLQIITQLHLAVVTRHAYVVMGGKSITYRASCIMHHGSPNLRIRHRCCSGAKVTMRSRRRKRGLFSHASWYLARFFGFVRFGGNRS